MLKRASSDSSTLCQYDALADEWNRRRQNADNQEGWAACPMVFKPYDGQSVVDSADMTEFVVYVPTQEQLEE